jgi:hypothetical protein
VARKRERWKTYQGRVDASRLVFIDETWVKTNMAPLRGWGAVERTSKQSRSLNANRARFPSFRTAVKNETYHRGKLDRVNFGRDEPRFNGRDAGQLQKPTLN